MSRNSRWSTHTHTIYVKTNSAKIYRLSQGILFVHYPPDLILNHYPLSRLSVTCHSSPVQTTQYILHMCVCVCGCQDFPITAWQPASSICIFGYIYFSALSHFCTASSCQTLYQISAHSDRCAVDMHAHMQKALSTLCMTEHAGVKEAPPNLTQLRFHTFSAVVRRVRHGCLQIWVEQGQVTLHCMEDRGKS